MIPLHGVQPPHEEDYTTETNTVLAGILSHIVYYSTTDQTFMYSLTDWALKNDKTLSNFYFARSLQMAEENRNNSLEETPSDTVYVFQLSDMMNCRKYPLCYYVVDGVIVGYVDTIADYETLSGDFFHINWTFPSDNIYLYEDCGYDFDEGRIIYPGAFSFGPYWELPVGKYAITISGQEITDSVGVAIYSEGGETYHDFAISDRDENAIHIELDLNEEVKDLEIVISNNSEENLLLKGIKLGYVE